MNIEHWQSYIDTHGFLQDRQSGSSGNGIMYSIYLALLFEEQPINDWIEKLKDTLERCWVSGGGLNRTPEGGYSKDLNQSDDYIAVGLLDVILRTDYSQRLLDVSRNNWGIINNVAPGVFKWKAWLFRMPQVRVHLQYAAGEKPDPLGVLLWSAAVLLSLLKLKHRDSRIKAWIMVETAYRTVAADSQIIRLVCDIWVTVFSSKFKGVGHAEYFAMPHPARTYFWGRLPHLPK